MPHGAKLHCVVPTPTGVDQTTRKRSPSEATAAFEKLVKDYPDQKELIARANEYLAGSSALMPAPWVDGEELRLKMRYEVLFRQGYQVLSAHTGESALRMFRDNQVDLVISDNRLPDLAGAEIIAEMKHLRPAVPIMMLSGFTQALPGAEIADSFITKGMSTEAFLAAVADLLKGRVATAANRRR